MTTDALFCSLTPLRIAESVRKAQQAVCYAGPGIQLDLAQAMVEVAGRLGQEMLTVSLDFDDRVMRMGYGNVDAVQLLLDAGIAVQSSPGLRTALVVVDNEGYIFTPTALYLEAEPSDGAASNAVRMSGEQVAQALARLSPAAKTIAIAQAKTPEAKQRIEVLTVDVVSAPITPEKLAEVAASLKEAPPVRFDLARQVRVFEPYLQYVELSLTGAAIQRHRMAIPEKIQKLGGSKELENRLRGRGLDDEPTIARRLVNARSEILQARWYDSVIVNDNLDQAYDTLRAVYVAAGLAPARNPHLLDEILNR